MSAATSRLPRSSPGSPRAVTCPPPQADYARTARPTPVALFADGSFISSAAAAGRVTPKRRTPYGVVVAPGWTRRVKSDGRTTNGRHVEVRLTNTATKERVSSAWGHTVIT
jgi:hypothetical protein